MDTGYSKWRKLDNAALAFPLVTDKNDTRVFRFVQVCISILSDYSIIISKTAFDAAGHSEPQASVSPA